MNEEERLNELLHIFDTDDQIRNAFFYSFWKYERIDGNFLFITHYDFDLNEPKYQDIRIISITNFSLDGIKKIINQRKNVEILINFPINFTDEEKNELFNNKEKYRNIAFIDDKFKEYSIEDLIKIEDYMDLMVKDIKESNLSPYEKYIAVYNIIKSYKCYKTEPDNSFSLSRNEYMFLMSDYGVCLGYINVLQSLLLRVGIVSECLICDNKHSILISYLKDPKYNIDSFQLADPTGDAIKDDYKQKTLTQSYKYINMTFEDVEKIYKSVDLLPFFKESNPDKMLEYLKFKFSKKKLILQFNRMARLFGAKTEMVDDDVINIFMELLSIIGDDSSKYNIDTANKVINYLKEKTSQKIGFDTELMAIYNVYNFINKDSNNNYADFVCDNFSFKNYFMGFTLPNRDDFDRIIANLEFGQVVSMYLNCSSFYVDPSGITNTSKENLQKLMNLYFFEKALFDLGVVYYNGNILLKNSLFDNYDVRKFADKDKHLKYDAESNNLSLILTNNIIHMKFKDFKNYFNEIISNINSRKK